MPAHRRPGALSARVNARMWAWLALLMFVLPGSRVAVSQPHEAVPDLLLRLEQVLVSGRPDAYVALTASSADREAARTFAAANVVAGTTHAAVRERERTRIPASSGRPAGLRLIVDVLTERGDQGTVNTWRLDLEPLPAVREARTPDAPKTAPSGESDAPGAPAPPQATWAIRAQDRLSRVEGLYRLRLDRRRQYVASGLRIRAEDLTLNVHDGVAHLAASEGGTTALVIVGRGDMVFSPAPAAEKGQVRLFSGSETLRTRFVRAFVRVNPSDIGDRLTPDRLTPAGRLNPSALAKAQEFFDSRIDVSFSLDLSDLSRDTWSLVPSVGDFLVDVDSDRLGVLTYTRSQGDAEDISLFDRTRRKNIAVYTSAARLARRGRGYDHAARLDYDVYRYDVDLSISPDRAWIEGRTGIDLQVRAYALSALTLRLAETLVVRSVIADRFGRLLTLRVRGQNSFIVNFPEPVGRDEWLTLQIFYSGRLPPQALDREAIVLGPPPQVVPQELEGPLFEPEPRFLYSNRSYWYPQSTVNEFALARLRLSVPARLNVVASGVLAPGSPTPAPNAPGGDPRKTYVFNATQPLRYLSAIVSRLTHVTSHVVAKTGRRDHDTPRTRPGTYYDSVSLGVAANPRQVGRARALGERAMEILGLYQSLLHDAPYPALTLAAVDDVLPGGHSPAYLGIVNQPTLPTARSWRNDPVSFDNFPEFFLAHELAHQYWGQGVGWQNYHEQWISEGFAQFFALLYAERTRDRRTWLGILRQMRESVQRYPDQGPIWLGYRLGHLRGDSRVFRAILYNKGALVLHMLRQWLGDDVFFRGLRRFYDEARFRRVGTEDVRRAFEQESGSTLERFFERWVYNDGVPQIRMTWRVVVNTEDMDLTNATRLENTFRKPPGSGQPSRSSDGGERLLRLRIEQIGETFDLPLTIGLRYASGEREQVLLRLETGVTNLQLPLKGELRQVQVDPDGISLARVVSQ